MTQQHNFLNFNYRSFNSINMIKISISTLHMNEYINISEDRCHVTLSG